MKVVCEVCSLPYQTRKEIEGMLEGGWTAEDLEHWVALRFRLKVSHSFIGYHYEFCMKNRPPGSELWEVARYEAGLVLYSDVTGQTTQNEESQNDYSENVPP